MFRLVGAEVEFGSLNMLINPDLDNPAPVASPSYRRNNLRSRPQTVAMTGFIATVLMRAENQRPKINESVEGAGFAAGSSLGAAECLEVPCRPWEYGLLVGAAGAG
jgi:hypothetical protein